MIMIISFVLTIAAINFILGFLSLTRGREKVNIYFFILSLLLGLWNLSIALRIIYGTFIFERLSYFFIDFIPIFVFLFIATILKADKSRFIKINLILSVFFCFINFIFIFLSFLNGHFFVLFNSYQYRLYFFIYVFLFLFLAFLFILKERRKIKFKQERIKITYLVIAFLVIFIGGTLDFTGGLGLHDLWYCGNVANLFYALIIFYAIFRYRLFNADFILKNFFAYTLIALLLSGFYLLVDMLFYHDKRFMFFSFVVFTLFIIYFSKYLLKLGYLFFEKFSSKLEIEKIKEEFDQIKLLTIDDEDAIKNLLNFLKEKMEMEIGIYLKSGNYFLKKWDTMPGAFYEYVEHQEGLKTNMILKYEAKDKLSKEVLNKFNCDILVFLSNIAGVLVGRKQTADISFLAEEIDLLKEIVETISFYIRIYLLRVKLIEKENEKRTDLMSHQIAHEIKNPLASLWGAAQLLTGKDEKEKENIEIIKQETQRLLKILDSWREFSKELKLNKTLVNLNKIIDDTIKVVKKLRDIKIEFIFEEIINITADEDKLKQVFFNVMKNSIDALELVKDPYIRIEMKKKNNFIEVMIRDNGCGIESTILTKIKTPFFTTKQRGSGLGLAISNKIIEAHNGVLLINSDGKSFTEVIVSLPL
ncbi:MAG: HAMP domain-containing histidine kinase [Candidatus Goldbacteria bacterium]|nr:HAMP domain-containing histidine kinase [Candidatus Goldiibacteriota bacterium]